MKRILGIVLVCLLTFLCAFAIICPQVSREVLSANGQPVKIFSVSDMEQLTSGTFDADGTVLPQSEPLVLSLSGLSGKTACLELVLKEPAEKPVSLLVQRTKDGSFSDCDFSRAGIFAGDKTFCTQLKPDDYTEIRVWFYESCVVENFSLYDTEPTVSVQKIPNEPWRYILVAVIVVLLGALAFGVDFKWHIFDKLCCRIKQNYIRYGLFLGGILLCILTGSGIEFLLRKLFIGPDSSGSFFNISTASFICVILIALFTFVFEFKRIGKNPDFLIFVLILSACSLVILGQPFSHISWDIDSHYPWAVQSSYYKNAYYSAADLDIKSNATFGHARDLISGNDNIERMNQMGETVVAQTDKTATIAHWPAGLFIALGRLFGMNFHQRFLFGEFGIALTYSLICYLAVRKLKSGKLILAIIALFPTNLFLAGNYSYDYWVTAFSMLGTACFITEMQQPDKPLSLWDMLVMCGSFALASLPKLIYVFMFILPFTLRKNWKNKRIKQIYYLTCSVFFVYVLVQFGMQFVTHTTGVGDLRGGSDVNSAMQMRFVFSHPFEFAGTLLRYLFTYYLLPYYSRGFMIAFGYLSGGSLYVIYIILLSITSLTDKCPEDRFKGYRLTRIVAILLYIGLAALIACALYVSYTPVGLDTINGCQLRYLTPMVFPLVLTVGNPGFRLKLNRTFYNGAILLTAFAVSLFNILTVLVLPMT